MTTYVVDTNVLLEQPLDRILETFEAPITMMIPQAVVLELDTFKKGHETKHIHARATIRLLDQLRTEGSILEGIAYQGHTIKVDVPEGQELDPDKPDNQIILAAKNNSAILLTQDIHERVVADTQFVTSEPFAPEAVDTNDLRHGYHELTLSQEAVEEFTTEGCLLLDPEDHGDLLWNEYVLMRFHQQTYRGRYHKGHHAIYPLRQDRKVWDVEAKRGENKEPIFEQQVLIDMLQDPNIHCVTAVGPSGCGKTLLSLAAGLEQTLNDDTFDRISVMRPLVPVGGKDKDIGFLPGNKDEKLSPWMGSTYDALEYLLEGHQMKDGDINTFSSRDKVEELIDHSKIELTAMAHIRGRSIPNQLIIIDDAQNCSVQEVSTIITRAAENTKIVFLGDLSDKQIDDHRLSPNSSGLAYVIDRMQDSPITGHITMHEVVRSDLAQLGVERL